MPLRRRPGGGRRPAALVLAPALALALFACRPEAPAAPAVDAAAGAFAESLLAAHDPTAALDSIPAPPDSLLLPLDTLAVEDRCVQDDSNMGMSICADSLLRRAEPRLTRVTARAREAVVAREGPDGGRWAGEEFDDAQALWRAWEDEECGEVALLAWYGGSGAPLAALGCSLVLVEEREADLRSRYLGGPGAGGWQHHAACPPGPGEAACLDRRLAASLEWVERLNRAEVAYQRSVDGDPNGPPPGEYPRRLEQAHRLWRAFVEADCQPLDRYAQATDDRAEAVCRLRYAERALSNAVAHAQR